MCYVTFWPRQNSEAPAEHPENSTYLSNQREAAGMPKSITGPKIVANLWTEFAAHRGEALATNGKEPENPLFSLVAATFERANT